MPRIDHAEAMRLSEIYTPKSLPARLAAFTPSSSPEQRRARLDAWQAEVARLSWAAANEDQEC